MEETNLMTRKALNDAYAVCPWLIENLKHLISNPESEMLKVMIKHDLLLIKKVNKQSHEEFNNLFKKIIDNFEKK